MSEIQGIRDAIEQATTGEDAWRVSARLQLAAQEATERTQKMHAAELREVAAERAELRAERNAMREFREATLAVDAKIVHEAGRQSAALLGLAESVAELVEVVRAMAPVSISVERTVDLGVTDEATGPRP